jgi:hypothetical protein
VYFPGGTYLISSSIIDYYYTQVRVCFRWGIHLLTFEDHRKPELYADYSRCIQLLQYRRIGLDRWLSLFRRR